MNIKILHMVEGAKQATGLTVIIDVFRAFTVEAYLMNNDAEKYESNTPKMSVEKDNIEEIAKGTKRIFSHFCKKHANGKPTKSQSNHIKTILP